MGGDRAGSIVEEAEEESGSTGAGLEASLQGEAPFGEVGLGRFPVTRDRKHLNFREEAEPPDQFGFMTEAELIEIGARGEVTEGEDEKGAFNGWRGEDREGSGRGGNARGAGGRKPKAAGRPPRFCGKWIGSGIAFEEPDEVGRARGAVGGVALEAGEDDFLPNRGQGFGPGGGGHGVLVEFPIEELLGRGVGEGVGLGNEDIEEEAEGVDVGGDAAALAVENLRGEEIGGAGQERGLGFPSGVGVEALGEAEVDDDGTSGAVVLADEHDVGGFEIAVDDAVVVEDLEGAADAGGDGEGFRERKRTAASENCGERLAVEELHGEARDNDLLAVEVELAMFDKFEHAADAFVGDFARDPDLAEEALQSSLFGGDAWADGFEGEAEIVQFLVADLIDFSHTAAGDELADQEASGDELSGSEQGAVLADILGGFFVAAKEAFEGIPAFGLTSAHGVEPDGALLAGKFNSEVEEPLDFSPFVRVHGALPQADAAATLRRGSSPA